MNVLGTNKLIDLALLSVFKGKVDELIQAGDGKINQWLGTLPTKIGDTPIDTWIKYIDESIKAVNSDASALADRVKDNEDAIALLNNADTVEDSVAQKIKAAFTTFKTQMSDDEVVNTFKEMVDYIEAHQEEYADIKKLVGDLPQGATVTTVVAYAQAYADSLAVNYAAAGEAQAAINALGGSANGSSHGIKATVTTSKGEVSEVAIEAPKFEDIYGAKGNAAAVQGATDETVKSVDDKLEALDLASEQDIKDLFK